MPADNFQSTVLKFIEKSGERHTELKVGLDKLRHQQELHEEHDKRVEERINLRHDSILRDINAQERRIVDLEKVADNTDARHVDELRSQLTKREEAEKALLKERNDMRGHWIRTMVGMFIGIVATLITNHVFFH